MKRRTRTHRAVLAVLMATLLLAATSCGKDDAAGGGTRPSTTARLQMLEPTPNEVTGPDLSVKLKLIDAQVTPKVTGALRGDRGHIHVSLDGRLISMAYGTSQDVHGLKPGAHSLQAEFVAADHAPFANRVVTAVLFTAKS